MNIKTKNEFFVWLGIGTWLSAKGKMNGIWKLRMKKDVIW